MEEETVYGTHEDSHVVMSDKVQSLAGSIYQEFEKMIAKYDEDVVKDLMPLVVNVLESLDLSYSENQEHQVELELLREDNEQLVTQYEREKQLRKASDQKLLEVEDLIEGERKEKGGKIESLESIVRMLELKAKNSSDHVYRLEEKEQEMKKEFAKLHERYTELFKTHMDYIERTKIIMGTGDRLEVQGRQRLPPLAFSQLNRSSGPVSFGFQSLEGNNMPSIARNSVSPGEFPTIPASPPESNHSATSLRNELEVVENTEDDTSLREVSEKGWSETLSPGSKDPSPDSSEECPPPPPIVTTPLGRTTTKKEQRSGNTLYQELSFQDADALGEMDEGADITGGWVHPGDYASSVNDNFYGMGKEVENLIMENNELLATKNALNIVKDDLIIKVDELTSEQEILREENKSLKTINSRLNQRLTEREEELKKMKEEIEKQSKSNKSDDEEDVPMAQRKRFTRVEMARVLMERNQYKERFMELQEAVRFTEMIRASKNETDLDKKSKQSVWKFFSSLFSGNDRGVAQHRKAMPNANFRYNAPTHHISPALDTMKKRSLHERKRGLDLLDSGDISNEKIAARRASERREQLRAVQAHVRKDDGRLHAYGWSLPAKGGAGGSPVPPRSQNSSGPPQVPVPVPVYCRPLMEKEDGMKIWCAAGVNLAGGRTKDGGEIVGASVFYSKPPSNCEASHDAEANNPVEQLEKDIEDGERQRKESEEQLSSLVWICTSTRSVSYVTVIDANNPADILEAFSVCPSYLLCIASVPGACESDYRINDEDVDPTPTCSSEGEVNENQPDEPVNNNNSEQSNSNDGKKEDVEEPRIGRITFVSCATGSEDTTSLPPATPLPDIPPSITDEPIDTNANELSGSPTRQHRLVKHFKEGLLKDGVSPAPTDNEINEELEKASSVLPTMWLGAQNGCIFVHSAVAHWKRCLHSIKLKDSVLSIVHVRGRVLCAVADCTVAIFRRGTDGQWDLGRYHVVDLGPPQHSIRCLIAVHNKVWCGYKNRIHVLDPGTMAVQKSLDVHPRKESHVRQMAWVGDGVWVSIRLDSTLRLYHAHTYQHLQDVDIEPYVSKMLAVLPTGAGKLGFSFVRITALLISCSRLWIGTGNGVIISVPLSEVGVNVGGSRVPGSVVRVFADPTSSHLTPATFIPYCSMQHAQLSFHGHRDAVKFFVSVPGCGGMSAATTVPMTSPVIENNNENEKPMSMLVMSGGEGYIDFRVGDDDDDGSADPKSTLKSDPSYLIVWQVTPPST
ncbi:JNK-interacting protein syd isoform X5 [Rhodnius prolixus]|uniref:JNK-interacting protein syd isoform X5 n=1 Tax=Rhodnius prolixus TaxID=13249 RepID=UPI003D18E9FF